MVLNTVPLYAIFIRCSLFLVFVFYTKGVSKIIVQVEKIRYFIFMNPLLFVV